MTLQFVLSCATRRFEGCAGGEGAWCDVALAGGVGLGSRTLGCDEGSDMEIPTTSTERFDKKPLSF